MKQPQKANFKRITLKKNLNEAIYKKIQKKIINTGRWSEEEHKLYFLLILNILFEKTLKITFLKKIF